MTKTVWKIYAIWAVWVGIAFFSVYPTCNWLTAQREQTYPLYLDMELAIPFVPEFYWIYMSMYVLFVFPPFFLKPDQLKRLGKQLVSTTLLAGLLFLLLPGQLGFTRIAPDNPVYHSFYTSLFVVDLPHNLVPSLHVIFSTILMMALLDNASRISVRISAWIWLILLCLSTLLVHQHHLLDVFSGLLIAGLSRIYYKQGEKHV